MSQQSHLRTATVLSWSEWAKLDATGMAELVRSGQVSAKELALQAGQAIRLLNPEINAICEQIPELGELAYAEMVDESGPFYGVPTVQKEIEGGLKGRQQTFGSKLGEGNLAPNFTQVVRNALKGGFNFVGMSANPPFAASLDTSGPLWGITRNPYDLELTPGGSSGGSSAAVAAGMVPVGTSSDGAGSNRIPAAFCALVSLKPTRGFVSIGNIAIPSFYMYSTGWQCKSVRDVAALTDMEASGRATGQTGTIYGLPEAPLLQETERNPDQLRIALTSDRLGRSTPVSAEISDGVKRVGRTLEGLGHIVEEVEDRHIAEFAPLWAAADISWVYGQHLFVEDVASMTGRKPGPTTLSPIIHQMWEGGADPKYNIAYWVNWLRTISKISRSLGKFYDQGHDLILCPVTDRRQPVAGGPFSLLSDEALDPWVERTTDCVRYTFLGNLVGMPGLALPAGNLDDGKPFGAQLYAPWGREDLLIRMAAQLERAKPDWFGRIAPSNSVLSIEKPASLKRSDSG